MCGITGIYAFNLVGKFNKVNTTAATMALQKRGPDYQDIYLDEWVGLGHRRLSIIDTSEAGNQPMWDESGRYAIIFNGEIFNYRDLKRELESAGVKFRSQSDTEVLLKLFIKEGKSSLSKLNGFFAFCIYDKEEKKLFIARDRFGIKPLLYLIDDDKFIFASEMKSLIQYGIEKDLDFNSLFTYLQLNYIPAPQSIFRKVKKLLPGYYLEVSYKNLESKPYYNLPNFTSKFSTPSYEQAKDQLFLLLDVAVQRQLVADVPLGCFLSGGIDSSIISALAVKHKPDLQTFSIGFRDNKFFDETEYAKLVASHLNTRHTVFSLSNKDLLQHVNDILNYIDEPFADSSAIPVYILSKETRKHATVALSGDGADEMLGGYNKHRAFYRAIHPGWKEHLIASFYPILKTIPGSRSNVIGNKIRQALRFSEGFSLPIKERYWRWASVTGTKNAFSLLSKPSQEALIQAELEDQKNIILENLKENDMNSVLLTDMSMVLSNDMLFKVDMMSMANSLEVRPPFLDHEVVNFISSLPSEYKINAHIRKRILQDTFREILPQKLYNRPKKGFEVPLLQWFRADLRGPILDDLLADKTIVEQGIFEITAIQKLKKRLFSTQPGDVHAQIWAIIVFQSWWKRLFSNPKSF